MTIEERIQALRKEKGLSQEQFADTLGVSRQAVSKWEMGQSMPEVEKLITMSQLFGVTIDFILKGETSPPASSENERRRAAAKKIGAQIVSAVAGMLILMAVIAALGRLTDKGVTFTMIHGLILESIGLMILLVGWFLAGNRAPSKPLFVVNVLMAGILPALVLSQVILGYDPNIAPTLSLLSVAISICIYAVLCGAVIYFAVIRRKEPR